MKNHPEPAREWYLHVYGTWPNENSKYSPRGTYYEWIWKPVLGDYSWFLAVDNLAGAGPGYEWRGMIWQMGVKGITHKFYFNGDVEDAMKAMETIGALEGLS